MSRKRLGTRRLARTLCYTPGTSHLHIIVRLSYGKAAHLNREHNLIAPGECGANIRSVVTAPTLGRPAILQPVCKLIANKPLLHHERWPHADKITWVRASPEEAEHNLLDKMLLAFAAPPNCFMTGEFESFGSSHSMEVAMLQRMYREPQHVLETE